MISSPVHHVRLFRGALPGVHAEELLSERSFNRHWHDSYGFGVMDLGGHRSASGRGAVEAVRGQIVTSNPGEVHDGSPLGHSARRWRMVHITPETMAWLVDAAEREFSRPVLDDPALRQSILRVLDTWTDPEAVDPWSRSQWEEALTQVCGHLLLRQGSPRNDRTIPLALQRVRECLWDRVDAPPDLQELAQLAGLSRFQLVRQFAQWHGLPPFAWLQQQRLNWARRLIAEGTPLAEAAQVCGFADQSHLTRQFRRSFGFTPGQWWRVGGGVPQ